MTDPAEPALPQHTVLTVLRGAEQWLQRRGAEAPKRSAELLLGHVLGLTRLQLYLNHDRPLDPAERDRMRALLQRRGQGEPVAYLLGSWSFRGLELLVTKAVLVPRPETEELIERALAELPAAPRVIDLGTGSGAIAIAIAVARPAAQVVAVEQSEAALTVARANAERHGVADRIDFRLGSWWEPVPQGLAFDLVVSNPPYIDPAAPAGLEPAVAAFEPRAALYSAPGDAASCYRALVAPLGERLAAGGRVWFETGLGASGPALAVLQHCPALAEVQLLADLEGRERFLTARRA